MASERTHWQFERMQHEEEFRLIERDRALEEIARLIRRYEINVVELTAIARGSRFDAADRSDYKQA